MHGLLCPLAHQSRRLPACVPHHLPARRRRVVAIDACNAQREGVGEGRVSARVHEKYGVARGDGAQAVVRRHALDGTVRQVAKIQNGLSSKKAKEIAKLIKDGKFKVQAQIQGEQVRVQGKSKDELQAVIALLKSQDFGIDLQYVNYR